MNEERLKRRYEREKKARLESERILEDKSRELYERNEELQKLSQSLEKLVEERTRDLVEARDQALAAAKAKSQFMANMSHEIRTPLNGVLGILNMFEPACLNEKHNGLLNTAKNSGRLLLEIVNDILDFSKLDAGQLALHEEAINLEQVVQETLSPLHISTAQKDINLVESFPDNFPKRITGDALRLKQIITNLLSNAIKFTDQGEVRFEVELLERQYKLIVSDSGIGMSEEQVDRIFHAFGQADGSITRQYGGTGLGLTITQSLIHMMGGSIQVKSLIGQGSTFIITLPLHEVDQGHSEEELDHYTEHTRFKAARVLLTEDNEVNQVVATHLLEKANLHVTLAENGKKAVEQCQTGHFDAVLMDIQMPVMDGLEACRQIRNLNSSIKDVPIIAMTAHATEEHRRDSFQAGMNEHITKPIEPLILHKTLGRYLEILPETEERHDPDPVDQNVALYDHLNTIDALKRLGGNKDLYTRLLNSFASNHAKLSQTVSQQLESGAFQDAQALLHTIKGSAANIGANTLSKIAASFESDLKNSQHSQFNELLIILENTWKLTTADIDNFLSVQNEDAHEKTSLSDQDVQLRLKLLEKHLKEDISQAEEVISELRNNQVADQFKVIIEELNQEIDVFNITSAQNKLSAFLEAN